MSVILHLKKKEKNSYHNDNDMKDQSSSQRVLIYNKLQRWLMAPVGIKWTSSQQEWHLTSTIRGKLQSLTHFSDLQFLDLKGSL